MVAINYSDEISSLNISYEFFNYINKHTILLVKRIIYQYFLLDFNPGSINIILFFISILISVTLGIFYLITSLITKEYTSAGNVSLFLISSIISIQLFFSFIFYDTNQRPLIRKLYKNK